MHLQKHCLQTTFADALVPVRWSREASRRRASMLVYNNVMYYNVM